MAVATLKEATEKLGLSSDDVVTFYKKGNKRIIEADFEAKKNKQGKSRAKDNQAQGKVVSQNVRLMPGVHVFMGTNSSNHKIGGKPLAVNQQSGGGGRRLAVYVT